VAYQSLYRRYRPQRFSEVRGQDHLVRALQNAVREDRVGHAYLLSGPRGTGKTSTARILAKVLNCENPTDGEPDGKCESCIAIEHGTSFDVHEMDAASNNKVEDIRDLVNKAALGTPGRTKVYILDEVHMLTAAASNALLKTLEEAPEHVVFVLATTDPQKVLPTIRSRCQHFELHLLPADELAALASYIIEDAGLDVPPGTVDYVVRAGSGSARDMESALDQVAAAGGLPDSTEALDELVEALCDRDTGKALLAVDRAIEGGRGPRVLGELLIGRLRDVFLASVGDDLNRLPDGERERVKAQSEVMGAAGATRALEVLGEAFVGIQDAPDPRITLEVALVRLTRPDAELSLSALADRVGRLERGQTQPEPSRAAGPSAKVPSPESVAPTTPPLHDEPGDEVDAMAPDSSPGSGAREALAQSKPPMGARAKNARATSTTKTAPSKRAVAERKPPPTRSTGPADAAEPEPPKVAPAPKTPAATVSDLPTRDEVVLAWGDAVLPTLPAKAKSRFASGRFVGVEPDAVIFGLPNKIHAAKCEEVRPEVEAALAAHFGRATPLRIIVDEGATPPPTRGEGLTPSPPAEPADEIVDLTELTDAPDAPSSGVDVVNQIFPGAEVVDGE
jgi:DNA polymerase-3 subunit gamma/tau